jgi:hypothetical protein
MNEPKVLLELIVISMLLNISLNNCVDVNETEVCDGGYVLIETYNQCVRAKRLGEFCSFTKQCQYFDNDTYCDSNWFCNIKCQNGQEFNPKIGRCASKLYNKTFEMSFRETASNFKPKNVSSNLTSNTTKTINIFSLLRTTSNYNGVCPFDNRWNKFTQSCEVNPFLVNSGTLLLSFGFAVAFIFIILIVYRRRQNESINLFQTLNAFQVSNNHTLEPREQVVYFVTVPHEDNTLPTYQEATDNRPVNCKLPTYEEAIGISPPNT